MIAKNKKRICITVEKESLEKYQEAAAEWGLTLSEYFTALVEHDITIGLTAQARCLVSERRGSGKKES